MSIDLTPVVERTRKDRALSNPESPRDRLRRRNAVEASVRGMLPALGLDELRIIETAISRCLKARPKYGEINLDTDARDWRVEGAEELADFLFYAAAREVAANDRRLERLRCEAADEMAAVERGLDELRTASVLTAADYASAWEFELGGEGGF